LFVKEKEIIMRVAISTDRDSVSSHFGRCSSFTIVDIEGGKVIKKETVDNPGHQPGFIPQFLHQRGVECIVCGGMGMRATDIFSQLGIQTIVGVTGKIDEVIEKLLRGTLEAGRSLCKPGSGKEYGLEKKECNHSHKEECKHQ
jgi:predicted Fe-Mo cluster-binding NifX family protein